MNYRIWELKTGQGAGFSAYIMRVLSQIHQLDSKYNIYENNSPLWIDWCTWVGHANYYEGDKMPFKNSWDYWFINPTDTDLALESIKNNPSDWISSDGQFSGYPPPQDFLYKTRRDLIEEMGKYTERYIKPKSEIIESLNDDITKYKTLGVHCRRSCLGWAHGNLDLKYENEDYLNNVMKLVEKHNFEKVYLATEETSIYEYFMEKIPHLIISQPDCYRVSRNESASLGLDRVNRPLHKYLMGKEILIDILNLSKCHSFLCYISGVSSVVRFFNNNKFDQIYSHRDVKNS